MKPDLSQIKKLAEAATPGPWEVEFHFLVTRDPTENENERVVLADLNYFHLPRKRANVAHVAASNPLAVLWMVERIEELEGAISRDGPHKITDARRWLARQLLDSQLSDDEAFGIAAFHPAVTRQALQNPSPQGPTR